MLKYLYAKEVFSEIPDEITLGISLSGCKIRCKNCHSKELWEDKGTILTVEELDNLVNSHKGITCVLLLGGEHDVTSLSILFSHIKDRVKTAWYSGLDTIPPPKMGIMQCLDYVKLGHYDENLGGLDSPTTNQRLYKIEHLVNGDYRKTDITFKLQKTR